MSLSPQDARWISAFAEAQMAELGAAYAAETALRLVYAGIAVRIFDRVVHASG
jgi:hypothetical protein